MKRIAELDSVRGLAIIGVLISHTAFPNQTLRNATLFLSHGVDVFFVLSGYLITTIIIENHREGAFLLNFYARRSLRIFPIYFMVVLFVYLLSALDLGPALSPRELLRFLTYTQSFPFEGGLMDRNHLLNPTWSLAVEEQFYMIWPAMFLVVGRRRFPIVILAGLCLAVACRLLGFNVFQINSRCDGLVLGALLAMIFAAKVPGDERPRWFVPAFVSAATLAAATPVAIRLVVRFSRPYLDRVLDGDTRYRLDILFVNLLAASLIGLCIHFSGRRWLSPMRNGLLRYVGTISYGLYLYHSLAFYYADRWFTDGRGMTWLSGLAGYAMAIGAAMASWYGIEQPILRLKKKFRYEDPHARAGNVHDPVEVPQVAAALKSPDH